MSLVYCRGHRRYQFFPRKVSSILFYCYFPRVLPSATWFLCFFPSLCSLGGPFTPLSAYIPTGADAVPARVYADPIEMNMKELKDVDPFEDMVCTFSFSQN